MSRLVHETHLWLNCSLDECARRIEALHEKAASPFSPKQTGFVSRRTFRTIVKRLRNKSGLPRYRIQRTQNIGHATIAGVRYNAIFPYTPVRAMVTFGLGEDPTTRLCYTIKSSAPFFKTRIVIACYTALWIAILIADHSNMMLLMGGGFFVALVAMGLLQRKQTKRQEEELDQQIHQIFADVIIQSP